MEHQEKKGIISIAVVVLSLSLIISTAIATFGYVKVKGQKNSITVTGSAKKQIKSDFIVWKGSFSAQSQQISDAYKIINNDLVKVKTYLVNSGVNEKDIIVSPINTIINYVTLPNGQYTSNIDSYRLMQEIEIRSSDVDKVTDISRESTKLINDGVQFQSYPPQYFYTKIADLKVDMLALATKDAKNRAEKIANNSASKIGSLNTAKLGVFQITPLYSNEVSDYGINDTSSIEKEIMSVVNCVFSVK